MIEDTILINENPLDILKLLFKDGVVDELEEKNYKITYFGEKSQEYLESLLKYYPLDDNNIEKVKSNLKNPTDERNYIIYIKFKNIYIGGISIFDFQSRIGFGLNKYINNYDKSFYIGQWENNKKCGIGFLKIDKNHLYFGNFKENQINEDGIYYNKENDNFFYGLFNEGEFKKGLYANLTLDTYYFGKFINSKKNDDFSVYVNYKMNRIFIGEIQNDIFIKGYIIFLKIEETNNNIILITKNIFYKNDEKYDYFSNKYNKYFEKIIYNVIGIINELKIALIKMKNKLSELENIYDDNIYNNRIGRYKSVENVFSFENELIKTYFEYSNVFNKIQKSLNIQDIKNKILL